MIPTDSRELEDARSDGAKRMKYTEPTAATEPSAKPTAQRNDPGLNFADNGAPPVNFVQVAGSLPYIWGVDADGGIWYYH